MGIKRKLIAMMGSTVLMGSLLAGCGVTPKTEDTAKKTDDTKDKTVELTWWDYPNFATLDNTPGKYEQQIIDSFNKKYPNIKVKVEMIAFNGGPEKVNAAIASKTQPDIIYDYPGRIIDYARQGVMAPLDTMITDSMKKEVPPNILDASALDGKYYMYPFNTTPFLLSFNKTMLEKAGLLSMLPLDKPDRLWTTDDFTNLLKAIKEKVPGVAPMVFYAKSSGGDQATRGLLANLYGGSVVKDDKSAYALNEEGPVKGLQWIVDGIKNGYILKGGEAMASNDALDMFLQGKAASTIIYSSVLKKTNATKKIGNFDEVFVPVPTPQGVKPNLEAYVGGLGIFDNGDAAKVEAAKKFVDFLANDPEWQKKNLTSTGGFSVKSSVTNLYDDAESKYAESMVKYSGKYYNAVPGFAEMRTYWFPAMQNAMLGKQTPKEALSEFVQKADPTLKKK